MSSIETYIATENPKEVAKLLREMGAPAITSQEDLLAKVQYATDKYGRKAFERLAKIDTPMRSLILTFNESEKKSNCGGFSGCNGSYSSAAGDSVDNLPSFEVDNQSIPTISAAPAPAANQIVSHGATGNAHPMLIVGAVLLGVITISILVKK